MATKDINLLPRILETEVRKSEYQRAGTKLSFILIGIIVLLLGSLFGWSLVVDNSLKKVEAESTSRLVGIKDNLDKELKMRALSSKIKLIKPLLYPPYQNSEIVTSVQEVALTNSSLETTEVTIEGTEVIYSGRAPTSEILEEFLTTLLDSEKGGKAFSQIYLTSLNRNETLSEYRFSLRMKYNPAVAEGIHAQP